MTVSEHQYPTELYDLQTNRDLQPWAARRVIVTKYFVAGSIVDYGMTALSEVCWVKQISP